MRDASWYLHWHRFFPNSTGHQLNKACPTWCFIILAAQKMSIHGFALHKLFQKTCSVLTGIGVKQSSVSLKISVYYSAAFYLEIRFNWEMHTLHFWIIKYQAVKGKLRLKVACLITKHNEHLSLKRRVKKEWRVVIAACYCCCCFSFRASHLIGRQTDRQATNYLFMLFHPRLNIYLKLKPIKVKSRQENLNPIRRKKVKLGLERGVNFAYAWILAINITLYPLKWLFL